jgi:hypothetical protein
VFPDNGDGVLVSVVDRLGVSVRTKPGVGRFSFMAVENGLGKVGLARETEGVLFFMETDVGREVGLGNPEEEVKDIPLSRSLIHANNAPINRAPTMKRADASPTHKSHLCLERNEAAQYGQRAHSARTALPQRGQVSCSGVISLPV